MTSVSSGAAVRTDGYARRVLHALRAHWRILPAYMVLVTVINQLRILALAPPGTLLDALEIGSVLHLSSYWLAAPLSYLAIALVEGMGLRGIARAAMTLVLIGGGVGIATVLLPLTDEPSIRVAIDRLFVESSSAFLWRHWWFNTATGLMLAGYLTVREREAAIVRAARDAEMERMKTQRAVLDSRLKVMQARVEPDLLFGVLSEAIELYPRAASAADQLLDDLIAYLRAALPHLRQHSSTVSREIALAQAWARIAPALRGCATPLVCTVAPDVADAQLPPLVLLRLVEGAVAEGARYIEISARIVPTADKSAARMRIAIDAQQPPSAWTGPALAEMRSIVTTALRGGGIAVASANGRVTLDVEWETVRSSEHVASALSAG